MHLNTEIFVMSIFIAGIPFFYFLLRDANMQGRNYFFGAYILLTVSNIFTVLEEFWIKEILNFYEHLFITMGAASLLVAILKLTGSKPSSLSPNKEP